MKTVIFVPGLPYVLISTKESHDLQGRTPLTVCGDGSVLIVVIYKSYEIFFKNHLIHQ